MSILDDLGDYCLDDEEFAKSAGVTKVATAWTKILEYTQGIVNEMIAISKSGINTKEFYTQMKYLTNAVAKMNDIMMCQQKIVGPLGNIFMSLCNCAQDENDAETLSDEEIIKKLDEIISGSTAISLSDVNNYIKENKEKVENDGGDHGDLDDIAW